MGYNGNTMKTVELKKKPNKAVIESLENALECAKNGELQGFIMVRKYDAGSGYAFCGLHKNEMPTLLGELMLLTVQLNNSFDGVHAEDIFDGGANGPE